MTYWEKRALESIGRMEAAANGALPELVSSFEDAKQQLQQGIESFYGRYAKNNAVSLQEAQKALSLAELQGFRGNLKEYEKLARRSIGTFNLQVDNLSVKARITRLQALEMQCDAILQRLYQEQKQIIEQTVTGVFTEEFYRSQFAIEQYTGFQFNFAAPSTSVIERVLKEPVHGADISTRLWRQDIDTGFRIRQALNQMFVMGKSPQYFAQELQRTIGAVRVDAAGRVVGSGKKYEAYRLLYNESAYATGQANLQAYRDDELEEYEIIATLDLKTSEVCRDHDGKHYPVGKAVTGENYPPFHVNCRTTTAPYIKGLHSSRMARDPVTGESIRTTAGNYEEWRLELEERLGKEKLSRLEKQEQNEKIDFEQYQKYKSIFGNKMLQSFANFQNLKYNKIEEWKHLKDAKQAALNAKSFEQIKPLTGKLGNLETRLWYKAQDENILNLIDQTMPLEQQAWQASELRCTYRTQARDLMKDQEARRQLDLKYPNMPFEYYVEKYSKPDANGVVPTMDEVYNKIIEKSAKTNRLFDQKAGVKDEN